MTGGSRSAGLSFAITAGDDFSRRLDECVGLAASNNLGGLGQKLQTLESDVTFGSGVTIEGNVRITARSRATTSALNRAWLLRWPLLKTSSTST